MKNLFLLSALLVALGLLSCHSADEKPATRQDELIPVKVLPLERQAGSARIPVSGLLTTDDETTLAFKTAGIIDRVLVEEGQAIKAGQLLATLKLTEIDAAVQQARLGVEKAERDYRRAENLFRDSVATLEQVQNARTALELARQQLSQAGFNRSYSEIRASRNGYVLRKLMNAGQVAAPGTPVLQVNGAGAGEWLLRVGVSDREWARIQPGDAAEVETQALAGRRFPGTVARRSEGADPATGAFTIDIRLQDKPQGLASGMFGKAVITTRATTGQAFWSIPYDALLDGDGNTGNVFITNDNKTAHKVPVLLAGMEKDVVLVSGGLEQARALIISGSAYLTDSSRIRIVQ
jgi:RND family efflux transporter MFP subunit